MKTKHHIPTLSDIKSVRSMGATSVPKVQRPSHLELFVLGMERSRVITELAALNKRRDTLGKQLDGIDKRVEKLHQDTVGQLSNRHGESTSTKPLKTMSIQY